MPVIVATSTAVYLQVPVPGKCPVLQKVPVLGIEERTGEGSGMTHEPAQEEPWHPRQKKDVLLKKWLLLKALKFRVLLSHSVTLKGECFSTAFFTRGIHFS